MSSSERVTLQVSPPLLKAMKAFRFLVGSFLLVTQNSAPKRLVPVVAV